MPKHKKLAAAESEVMDCVWQMPGKVTVREVHNRLYPNSEKAYTTLQTVMNILVDKNFLRKKKIGMVNFYTANIRREDAMKTETRSLVSRIFHGSFGALATHLIKSGELSAAELDDIKKLIEAQEKTT
ncbi:MAG: BlaI/MecI/CopY family transcriptional regulator [Deferribacteres bacterium]|nr:BlaI/MecI/CopY family transcriptional regulator [candidate division KSB1 bacterium]MCB9503888.1 BlaI/MecI/CopY family transcriptional regulator [Deferribacteres bacterium]